MVRWREEQVEYVPVSAKTCPRVAVFRKPGTKPPILFTSGGGWSGARWAPFFTYLTANHPELAEHEWVTWDLPGRGWSTGVENAETTWLTMHDLAEISHEMMYQLYGNQPYARVAHSNGCLLDLAAWSNGWGSAYLLIDPAPVDMTLEHNPTSTLGGLRQLDYLPDIGDTPSKAEAMRIDAFTTGQLIRQAHYAHRPGALLARWTTDARPDAQLDEEFVLQQKTAIANSLLIDLVKVPSSHWIPFPAGVQTGTPYGKPGIAAYALSALMRHLEADGPSTRTTPCLLDPDVVKAQGAVVDNRETVLQRLVETAQGVVYPAGRTPLLENLIHSPAARQELERRAAPQAAAHIAPSRAELDSAFAELTHHDPSTAAGLLADWIDHIAREDIDHVDPTGAMTALGDASDGLRGVARILSGTLSRPSPSPTDPIPRSYPELIVDEPSGPAARLLHALPFVPLTTLGKRLEELVHHNGPDRAREIQLLSAVSSHRVAEDAISTSAAQLLLADPVETDPYSHPALTALHRHAEVTAYELTVARHISNILGMTDELRKQRQFQGLYGSSITVTSARRRLPISNRPPSFGFSAGTDSAGNSRRSVRIGR